MAVNTLICTIGTSLFGNLSRLTEEDPDPAKAALVRAYQDKNWQRLAHQLRNVPPKEGTCGAEINSMAHLYDQIEIDRLRLHLLHSDTDAGRDVADVLRHYFRLDGWEETRIHRIEGLKDDDTDSFRTQGLRNLVRVAGELTRESGGPEFCAIDATGGYKAQIAIAVLMGQALDIPVYYKHEGFDEIISFPPLPVALDYYLWQKASGMFMALSRPDAAEPWKHFAKDWDERFEPLVDRAPTDGEDLIALSATGQIFHETFYNRFRKDLRDDSLPPEATDKKPPGFPPKHGWGQMREGFERFMQRVTDEVPYVRRCRTDYLHPGLPESPRFRLSSHGVQGIYSDGKRCGKFIVDTTADDDYDLSLVVADLNRWREESGAG